MDADAGVGKFLEIWSVPLANDSLAVVLANKGPIPSKMTATWEMLGLKSNIPYKVRDLWKHVDFPVPVTGETSSIVGSHDVVMLILSKIM